MLVLSRTHAEMWPLIRSRSVDRSPGWNILPYVLAASFLGAASALVCWRFFPIEINLAETSIDSSRPETWGDAAHDPHSPGFRTVGLKSLARREGVTLSIVRNESVKQWLVLDSALSSLDSDSSLQLWAELDSAAFVRLADLPVSETGTAGAVVNLSDGTSEFAMLWLTVEDSVSAEQPGGEVVFQGAIE